MSQNGEPYYKRTSITEMELSHNSRGTQIRNKATAYLMSHLYWKADKITASSNLIFTSSDLQYVQKTSKCPSNLNVISL
jgi:hypothetical protein